MTLACSHLLGALAAPHPVLLPASVSPHGAACRCSQMPRASSWPCVWVGAGQTGPQQLLCPPPLGETEAQARLHTQVIDAIARAVAQTPGCTLLDVDAGPSTNRTVYTFVGRPEDVVEGALNAARTAHRLIDMSRHRGEGGGGRPALRSGLAEDKGPTGSLDAPLTPFTFQGPKSGRQQGAHTLHGPWVWGTEPYLSTTHKPNTFFGRQCQRSMDTWGTGQRARSLASHRVGGNS